MKTVALAIAAILPLSAAAAPPAGDPTDKGFHESLYVRYCDKLREGPEAYVAFVKRLKPIHGYTFEDFAPARPGAPVRADCRVAPERIAAVHALRQKDEPR